MGDYYSANSSGSFITNNNIELDGNPDPNYLQRENWGDGILVFEPYSVVMGNHISLTNGTYGRVGVVFDHANIIEGNSVALNNTVKGDGFISCYHIEHQMGVLIDASNTFTYGTYGCGRQCFTWESGNSSCCATKTVSPISTPSTKASVASVAVAQQQQQACLLWLLLVLLCCLILVFWGRLEE